MNELPVIAKAAADFGGLAVLAVAMVLLYRLVDKWGGAFVAAQNGQTIAMTEQASAVTQLVQISEKGQSMQGEVLMAVRMLADRIDQQRNYLQAIDQYVRDREKAGI